MIHAQHKPVDRAFAMIMHGVASTIEHHVLLGEKALDAKGEKAPHVKGEQLMLEQMELYPMLKNSWHYHHNLAVLYRQQNRLADAAESMVRCFQLYL